MAAGPDHPRVGHPDCFACCAHHVVDLVPLLGAAGVAGYLFDCWMPLMIAGLSINLAASAIAARRLAHVIQPAPKAMSCVT